MFLLICFLIAVFAPTAYGTCGTCSLSGDQHFITLDGAEHHYYGRGWHRLYQLDRFEVQCLFADCKTGAETIDGHRRRNDGRRVCLRACRAQFTPPGSICPQVLNWEPLQIDAQGQSQIEVNGARLQSGKGISQAAKDQSWWLRIERVGRDAAAVDVMLGGGAGGLALRLGPKRIVTVTVRGLQGGRGLCGSCDAISSNDLAGATYLNVSDCDGHNRFADAHRRGASGFALIPVKPECAGGTPIKEQEEVNKLLKEAAEVKEQEEEIHESNENFAMMGSDLLRDGAPDYDPKLIVPPVATFTNQTLLDAVVHDCQAGMLLTPNDERMKMAIDNCVLDKARGRGFEIAAAANIVAYVQSLMINEQADLAQQRLTFAKNFCAMCQAAIQTFVIDTKPILRHLVEKQAHWYEPGVVQYSALVPAPFELSEPEISPRPTRMPPISKLMSIPKPIILPDNNSSDPKNVTTLNAFKNNLLPSQNSTFLPPVNNVSPSTVGLPSSAPKDVDNVVVAVPELAVPASSSPTIVINATQSPVVTDNHLGSEPPSSPSSKEINSTAKAPKEKSSKKSKSDDDSNTGKYHLKGSKPVSNEGDESDDDSDDDDDSKSRRHKKGKSHKKKKKLLSKNKDDDDNDDNDDDDDDDDDNDDKKKSKSDNDDDSDDGDSEKKGKSDDGEDKKNPSPSPLPTATNSKVVTPAPTTAATTRAPIFPGSGFSSPFSPDPSNSNLFTSPNAPPNLVQMPNIAMQQMPAPTLFPSPLLTSTASQSSIPTSNVLPAPLPAPTLFNSPVPRPDILQSSIASPKMGQLPSNIDPSPVALPESLHSLSSAPSGIQPATQQPASLPSPITTTNGDSEKRSGSAPQEERADVSAALFPVVIKATPVMV